MILGQLIQAGRRFCECRSRDFIPADENTLVVVAYSIHDEFAARSYDIDQPGLPDQLQQWLLQQDPVGYLLIRRDPANRQTELPRPIGRQPMDHITMTAATEREFETVSFLLEPLSARGGYRLLQSKLAPTAPALGTRNLLQPRRKPRHSENVPFLPAFAESLRA